MKKKNGFTLAELLIVVAIIAVLVAIGIPVFITQLEKAREATDLANVRSAYAAISTAVLTEDKESDLYDAATGTYKTSVQLVQTQAGFQTKGELTVGGISSVKDNGTLWKNSPAKRGTCTVSYDPTLEAVVINWQGYSALVNYQWELKNGKISLVDRNVVSRWVCSAIPDVIETTNNNGKKLVVSGIDSSSVLNEWIQSGGTYEIGYFITDPNNENTMLYDSTGKKITSSEQSFEIKTDKIADGENVNVVIQVFKVNPGRNGSVEPTAQELTALENLISFK